jgi:trehalose-phosphatase
MIRKLGHPERSEGNSPSLRSGRLAARLTGSPLAILLDIDGTLAPIAPRPGDAAVPQATLDVVAHLTRLPNTHVAIVTGRSVADAQRLVPLDGVGVIGNHGFEILGEDGAMIITPDAHAHREPLRVAGARLSALAKRYHGVVVEDKTWTMSVHYRLADRSVVGEITSTVRAIAAELGLVVTTGKEVIEVRPPIRVNKGTAAVEWAASVHALSAEGVAIYIGDDRTDEDAFQSLRAAAAHAVTIRVGESAPGESSSAEFVLGTPDDVRAFLEALVELRSEKDSPRA